MDRVESNVKAAARLTISVGDGANCAWPGSTAVGYLAILPRMPWPPRRGRSSLIHACAIVAALMAAISPAAAQNRAVRGVIVKSVAPGSAGQRSGLQADDVLTAWERGASAGQSSARGSLVSPFDLTEIEIEQAPRGTVTLRGRRGREPLVLTMPAGRWQISARCVMNARATALYTRGAERAEAGDRDRALADWRAAALASGDDIAAAWLRLHASNELRDGDRMTAAHAALSEALVLARRAGNRAAIAGLQEAQGQLYERQRDAVRAERAYRATMTTRRGAGGPGLATAKGFVDLAFVALDRGDMIVAEQRMRQAAAIQEKLGPGSIALARSLSNLGNFAESRGDLDAAEPLFTTAVELLERQVPDTRDVSAALSNLGKLVWRRGNMLKAAALHERSLAISERLDPSGLDVAGSFLHLGSIAADRGRFAEAEQLFRRSLAIFARLAPGSADEATVFNNLADLLKSRGDLPAAEAYHLRALAVREKTVPDSVELASSLNNLGEIAGQRGDPVRADDYFKRSLAILERVAPESVELAAILNNLGVIAEARGNLAAAEIYLQRALAIKQRRAPASALVAASLVNLGSLAETRHDIAAARELYEAARGLLEAAAPDTLDMATVLGNLSDLADHAGDRAEADRLSARALAIDERLAPQSESHADALRRIGRQAARGGDHERAAVFLARALDALESQTTRLGGSDDVRTAYAGRGHEFYVDYIETLMAMNQPVRAFETLERSRARGLRMILAERDLVLDGDLSPELVEARKRLAEEYDAAQESLSTLNPSTQATEVDRLQARLRDLRESRARIIERVRAASPRLAALQYAAPLDLAAIQQALDAGTVLLSYHVGKEQSRLFVLRKGRDGRGQLVGYTIAAGETTLREDITALRRLIERQREAPASPATAPDTAFVQAAQHLFELLIAPAEKEIDAAERILLVPDGPLHSLPFAALVRKTGTQGERPWQYVVDWKPLHTALSATVFAELQKTRPSSPPPQTLVAFGDPLYPATETQAIDATRAVLDRALPLAPLPATRVEVASLSRVFDGQATVYLGAEATEAHAKAIKSARYLHFATHGLLDARSPLNSALALSLPAQRRDGEENGLLQAWEILEQMRLDTDLVTLSACETALGAELAGEGLIGLTRAFHYAGARSVLASQWRVADDSTADLMVRFYGHLKNGLSKDEALRRAQRDVMAQPRTAAPFHWAAFTLSGDWR